jgi:hypothetical protein
MTINERKEFLVRIEIMADKNRNGPRGIVFGLSMPIFSSGLNRFLIILI